MIAVAIVGSVAVSVTQRTQSTEYADTFDKPLVALENLTLSGYRYVSLVSVKNETGGTIAVSNYTIYPEDGNNLIELTSLGWNGDYATVTYKADVQGRLYGVNAILGGLVVLVIIAGIIVYITKISGLSKK